MLRERVKVGLKGRIVIPHSIRKELELKKNSILEVYLYNEKIIMEVLVK
jgi:AbrB family looped-hinge helix DNA binding protein